MNAPTSAEVQPLGILVVEDDPGLRRLILRRLGREGYRTRGASSGAEALVEARACDGPSLLLLDYQLPDMNAHTLVNELQKDGVLHPFVIMTGHGDERLAVELMKLGAWDYLIKDDGFLDFLPLTVRRAEDRLRRELELEQARAEVAERERYHRGLLQQLQDGLVVVGIDGCVVDANERFEALLGRGTGSLAGVHCAEIATFFEAGGEPDGVSTVAEVLAGSGPRQRLYSYTRDDGDIAWVDVVFSPLRNAEGEPWQVVVAVRDVTELKTITEEQQLVIEVSRLLNQATDRADAMRGLLERLHAWSGSDAVAVRLALGDDFPYFETRGFGETFVQSERHLCTAGPEGQVLLGADGSPRLACLCGSVLQGRADPAQPFFTASGSFWTNSTSTLRVEATEEALGGPIRGTCHGAGYESIALIPLRHGERVLGLLQFNDRRVGRFSRRRVDLLERIAQHVALAVAQYLGREELRRREVELRHAQKMDSLGRLSSGIAHEINTPLQYLGDSLHFVRSAYESTLARGGFDRVLSAVVDVEDHTDPMVQRERLGAEAFDPEFLIEELPRAFERAEQGLDRVRAIVRSMRQLSHPSGERPTPADLNQLVRDTLVVARNEYKYVATVVLDLDELPPIRCFASDLGQVLLNLLVNAAQAIEDDPARGRGLGNITIATRLVGDEVELSVTDDGAGVPEPLRRRLFEPFFTTKPPGKGTGQGLAIAYAIVVDRHGGSIGCDDAEGGGTRFVVRLPLQENLSAEGARHA